MFAKVIKKLLKYGYKNMTNENIIIRRRTKPFQTAHATTRALFYIVFKVFVNVNITPVGNLTNKNACAPLTIFVCIT